MGAFKRLLLAALLLGCSTTNARGQAAVSVHLTLGNPSHARADDEQPGDYLLLSPQYALSYNELTHAPNWVSWHLAAEWLGGGKRLGAFHQDDRLPSGWYRVRGTSYAGSGFDRGHLCPAGDRTRSRSDNAATFTMTNIMPQAPRQNHKTWRGL